MLPFFILDMYVTNRYICQKWLAKYIYIIELRLGEKATG